MKTLQHEITGISSVSSFLSKESRSTHPKKSDENAHLLVFYDEPASLSWVISILTLLCTNPHRVPEIFTAFYPLLQGICAVLFEKAKIHCYFLLYLCMQFVAVCFTKCSKTRAEIIHLISPKSVRGWLEMCCDHSLSSEGVQCCGELCGSACSLRPAHRKTCHSRSYFIQEDILYNILTILSFVPFYRLSISTDVDSSTKANITHYISLLPLIVHCIQRFGMSSLVKVCLPIFSQIIRLSPSKKDTLVEEYSMSGKTFSPSSLIGSFVAQWFVNATEIECMEKLLIVACNLSKQQCLSSESISEISSSVTERVKEGLIKPSLERQWMNAAKQSETVVEKGMPEEPSP
ncbi:hypothetical protein ADUPG1_011635 [Aduncisulcus paluster]|uniref:Uncharacterized protein n=1 Tax=Aduncisulcus paluster TaxID=2918883 RepID=A0ABQ5JWH9_9EUKA|nr:hypothetical protein ADUPG1_011635 [Aduncisulcus paluster]